MKTVLTIILLVLFTQKFAFTEANESFSDNDIEKYLKALRYEKNYQTTIDFIKLHEGFSGTVYNDRGYDCVGYGQRVTFFDGVIQLPVSKKQAEIILRKSFAKHVKIVKQNYPNLNLNQTLAVAHMSYCIGIGKIIKYKLIVNNKLDIKKMLNFEHRNNRIFEIEMFYK